MMKEIFDEQYNRFKKNAEEKNKEIFLDYKNEKISLVSKEILSLLFSECLQEDIDTVRCLKDNNCRKRYMVAVIRNMCEQVIEYLYIMKNQELIPTYLGEDIKECEEQEDLFTAIKRTGKSRFGNRPVVKKMAEYIGEATSSDDKLSLYDIFSVNAEFEHNSYFHHILDIIGEVEDAENEKQEENELDYIFLIYILSAFENVYYNV